MNGKRTPREITRLERRRREADLSYAGLGKILGKKRGSAWRYCLPPSRDEHRRPDREAAEALARWTKGAITVANYAELVDAGGAATA